MNTRLLFVALLPLLILGGCTKETTETKTTTVTKPYVAPTFPFWGTWKVINEDPMDTFKTYYVFDQNALYGVRMEEEEFGLRDLDYDIVKGDALLIKYDGDSYRPYEVLGDTMIVYDDNTPGEIEERMVRVANAPNPDDWYKKLTVLRKTMIPDNYGSNNNVSFGIDGDFLYVNLYNSNIGNYKFYKLNTINGSLVDSANVPGGNWHALHFKASANKLYNTRYSGTINMQQRTGLMGVNSNLSSNAINSVRTISTNGSSGTVYAFAGNTFYSGSEGGNFSSLYSFTGQYPRGNVYYKSDQFLGEYNNTLVLFEISPAFKVIRQYSLPESRDSRVYESISTNGSDIWVMGRDEVTGDYAYFKVTL